MSLATTLLATPSLTVVDVRCASPRSGPSPERGGEATHLALPRRGLFTYHLGARAHVADASTALLHRADASYRVSHPGCAGDDVTVIALAPGLADELIRAPTRVAWPVPPAMQLEHHRLHRALRTRGLAGAEERVLELLAALLSGPTAAAAPPARGERRLVDAVKERLNAALDRNEQIGALAAGVGASPFHLMRTFRAVTGVPVRAYRRRLRVLAALAAIAEGERDLAAVAVRVGFAHHGHLCEAFRAVLGTSPGEARRLTAARTFLEAAGGSGR